MESRTSDNRSNQYPTATTEAGAIPACPAARSVSVRRGLEKKMSIYFRGIGDFEGWHVAVRDIGNGERRIRVMYPKAGESACRRYIQSFYTPTQWMKLSFFTEHKHWAVARIG